MTACLLNIDLIEDCLRHLPASETDRIIARTNELVGLFRSTGRPIIWIRQEFADDLSDAFLEMRKQDIRTCIAGTPGAQIDSRLDVNASDRIVIKKRYSAFFGTDLDAILKRLNVEELILTGVNTHACIRATAVDAYQRDLEVVLASDCIGSYDEQHARVSMRYMDGKIANAMTNREIHARLVSAGAVTRSESA